MTDDPRLDAYANAARYLDLEETKRLLTEALEAHPGGLSEQFLHDLFDQVNELAVSAAMLELWRVGRARFDLDEHGLLTIAQVIA